MVSSIRRIVHKCILFCFKTKHRPFCDGSHRKPEIQEMRFDGKSDLWDPTSETATESISSAEEEIDELVELEENDESSTTTK